MNISKYLQFIKPYQPIPTSQQHDFSNTFRVGKDVFVFHDGYLDGGGTWFGQNYPRVLELLYPKKKFTNCLEWCAGPGFIGFRLLSDGLCENLTLIDCYGPAIEACNKTVAKLPRKFKNRVTTVLGSSVAAIPEMCKFDLVVGNPPHFCVDIWEGAVLSAEADVELFENQTQQQHFATKITDKHWAAHQDFFANIKKNLTPDAVILLQESVFGSSPVVFEPFVAAGDLTISRAFRERRVPEIYYLEITNV